MGVADEAATRFAELAAQGRQIPLRESAMYGSATIADTTAFAVWRTRSLNALRAYLPAHHAMITEFDEAVSENTIWSVERGIGILQALAADAKDGFLFTRLSNLIAAEVFNDFLEMADHLVRENHYHAAASLLGAVLEDSLRRLATNNGIEYAKRDGLDSLNKMLAKAGVYNAAEHKRIDFWREVRNIADHGRFDEVNPDHVGEMLTGVTDFVGRYVK